MPGAGLFPHLQPGARPCGHVAGHFVFMTEAQLILIDGGRDLLAVHGVFVQSDTGVTVMGLVTTLPEMPDPDKPAQAKTPLYSTLQVLISDLSVAQARAVSKWTEGGGKWHKPLRYAQPLGSDVWHRFTCESQRS